MQLSYNDGFDDRMAFYGMRLHAGNVKEGEKYQNIKRTIIIDILDFAHPLLKGKKEFCTDFKLRSSDGGITLTNKFIIYFVELKKIPDGAIDDLTKLEKWLMFLKNEGGREMYQTLKHEPMISRAITVAEDIARDKHERMIAQYREDAIRDYNWGMSTSFDNGISVGEQRGMTQSARNMLKLGFDIQSISSVTGLSEGDIRALQ